MSYRKPSISEILGAADIFESSSSLYGEETAKVHLDMTGSLPRIRFTWRPVFTYYRPTEDESTALEAAGFVAEKSSSDGRKFFSLQQKHAITVTFCNFRRYGWSYSTDPAGKHGYCRGVTYANAELPLHFLCGTPDEVIRDSLVATWAELKADFHDFHFTAIFGTMVVSALIKRLYDDAVAHATRHATARQGRTWYNVAMAGDITITNEDGTVTEIKADRSKRGSLSWEYDTAELAQIVPKDAQDRLYSRG